MQKKTLGIGIRLGMILALSASEGWSRDTPRETLTVTISVFNEANVPAGTLVQAEQTASRIFQNSGISVKWVNCSSHAVDSRDGTRCRRVVFPDHLQVHILQRPISLRESALGISFLDADGRGCYADIFYGRVEKLYEGTQLSPASILGHVVAHEIGHLLLGTSSHSAGGIMRAHWQRGDLVRAGEGLVVFSGAESQRMREKLSSRLMQREAPTVEARIGD